MAYVQSNALHFKIKLGKMNRTPFLAITPGINIHVIITTVSFASNQQYNYNMVPARWRRPWRCPWRWPWWRGGGVAKGKSENFTARSVTELEVTLINWGSRNSRARVSARLMGTDLSNSWLGLYGAQRVPRLHELMDFAGYTRVGNDASCNDLVDFFRTTANDRPRSK